MANLNFLEYILILSNIALFNCLPHAEIYSMINLIVTHSLQLQIICLPHAEIYSKINLMVTHSLQLQIIYSYRGIEIKKQTKKKKKEGERGNPLPVLRSILILLSRIHSEILDKCVLPYRYHRGKKKVTTSSAEENGKENIENYTSRHKTLRHQEENASKGLKHTSKEMKWRWAGHVVSLYLNHWVHAAAIWDARSGSRSPRRTEDMKKSRKPMDQNSEEQEDWMKNALSVNSGRIQVRE